MGLGEATVAAELDGSDMAGLSKDVLNIAAEVLGGVFGGALITGGGALMVVSTFQRE